MNERQFGQVIRYQAELYFDPKTEGAEKRLADILEQKQLPHELIGKTDFLFRTGENTTALRPSSWSRKKSKATTG